MKIKISDKYMCIFIMVFGLFLMVGGCIGIAGGMYGFGEFGSIVLGVIILLIGLILLINNTKQEKLKRILINEGRRVMADIHEVVMGNEFIGRSNKLKLYKIICKWTDDIGVIHLIKSGWLNKYPKLGDLKQLAVYIDRNDYTRYYVDKDAIPLTQSTSARTDDQGLNDAPIQPRKAAEINNYYNWQLYMIFEMFIVVGLVVFYIIHTLLKSHVESTPLLYVVLMLICVFAIGTGFFVNALLLYKIFAQRKTIQALLVSIEKTGEYMDAAGKSLFLLKFQDDNGRFYFFPINDTSDYNEGDTYDLTIKAKKVLNVGARSFRRVFPRKVKPGYWSGVYVPIGNYNAKQRKKGSPFSVLKPEWPKWVKIESPLALMICWLSMITAIMSLFLPILYSIVPVAVDNQKIVNRDIIPVTVIVLLVTIALVFFIVKDYMCKRKENDEGE